MVPFTGTHNGSGAAPATIRTDTVAPHAPPAPPVPVGPNNGSDDGTEPGGTESPSPLVHPAATSATATTARPSRLIVNPFGILRIRHPGSRHGVIGETGHLDRRRRLPGG